MTWTEAQTYCRDKFIDLSTFEKRVDILNCEYDQCWIGLSKGPMEPYFTQWSDGSRIKSAAWEDGEPGDTSINDCVTVLNASWLTENCTASLNFVCYKWVPKIILVQQMLNWEDALAYCRTHYTDLISLNTELDLFAANMTSIQSQTPTLWTGLRFMDGVWFWVNKQPVQKLTIMPSCPMRPYQCGALKSGSYVLENKDCNEKMNFICYDEVSNQIYGVFIFPFHA